MTTLIIIGIYLVGMSVTAISYDRLNEDTSAKADAFLRQACMIVWPILAPVFILGAMVHAITWAADYPARKIREYKEKQL